MSWQRQVLASRGYLELGMLEDATLALEQLKAEDKTRKAVSYAALAVHRLQRFGRPSRLPQTSSKPNQKTRLRGSCLPTQ